MNAYRQAVTELHGNVLTDQLTGEEKRLLNRLISTVSLGRVADRAAAAARWDIACQRLADLLATGHEPCSEHGGVHCARCEEPWPCLPARGFPILGAPRGDRR
jgi:hypothetical protein